MTPNNIFNTMMAANPTGGSHSALLQKQMSFKSSVGAKPEDMDNAENSNAEIPSVRYTTNSTFGFICCAPCTWLRSSTAVHKIAITTATLLVTSLLVVSPILFLISTAPSQLPRNCYTEDEKCKPTTTPPPECLEPHCRAIAHNIHSTVNWKFNPCEEFKKFSCRNNTYNTESFSSIQSAQKAVDLQMEELLQHNTISGPFRKLGRLYGSCLRQSINSSSLRLILNQLGGYLPIGAVGPSSISELISKIYNMGPTPIVDIYFDLSYGKHPHAILIVSAPSTAAPILESKIRWMGPKAPPYNVKRDIPKLLPDFIETFLPNDLTLEQRASENEAITTFIKELNKILVEHTRRGFWDSTVLYNISSMFEMYPTLNWTSLIPSDWNGPIVVRSSEYMKAMEWLLTKYSMRVAHNSILVLFALGILPQDYPNPKVCTKATMWALPDIASSLLIAQYSASDINEAVKRIDVMFKSLKAHLKRAPSLKGAALVKLSALKIQAEPWRGFSMFTAINKSLELIDISSDNWFENVLNIYKRTTIEKEQVQLNAKPHDAWAYPTVAKVFYDTLSHSIVVPISAILRPYFDARLPPYIQYASVGVAIAKEILRSITKSFEDKAMRCVPKSVNIFSNYSRMEILIHSGGMQISYHSMLSLTGPMKGMPRLPGLHLTPTQTFFLVSAQELCADSHYADIDITTQEFEHIFVYCFLFQKKIAGLKCFCLNSCF
ncbi:neprilysin-like 16 isoform X2 [Haematobia irritans]|uniref:neprilysin-like 16 isoform X2 n=1 Tax=Haematobia irritans TaxID=7368 RepID=UPI003F508BE8